MDWIDLSAGDAEFYTRLFGWTLDGTVFTYGGKVVAGYGSPVPDDLPPSWLPHVFVDDADEAAARIGGGGGRVELAVPETPLGRLAVVTDPAGARFVVREPDRTAGRVRKPFALTWIEVCTPDPPATRQFYAQQFRWTPHDISMALPAGDVPYTVFTSLDEEMAGVMPAGGPFPPGWLAYLEVTDCDVIVRVAAALGGEVVVPPTDIPRIGRVAVLAGRSGETFALMEMPAAA